MRVVEALLDGIDVLTAWMRLGLRATVDSHCELQTADSETVLVANDGSLVSVFSIDGVMKLIGDEEFKDLVSSYQKSLARALSGDGHTIQVVYAYDRDRIHEKVRENYAGTRAVMKTIKLDLEDLVLEKEKRLPEYCTEERIYLVLWTRPSVLTSEQSKRAFKEQSDNIAKSRMTGASSDNQNIFASLPALRDEHDAIVKSFYELCRSSKVKLTLLDVHSAVHLIRAENDPSFTDKIWSPVLPGDKIKPSIKRSFSGDISELLWPSLASQVFPRDAFNVDFETCIVGNVYYGMLYIDLYPREVLTFNELLSRCLNSDMSWRVSFLLEGGGMSELSLKKAFASVLSFSSVQNRLIADGIDLLSYIDINTDEAMVKLRTVFCTWAPNNQKLKENVSLLARAVQGWGGCDISQVSGDSFQGYVGSLPAVSSTNVAPMTVAPLTDVFSMMPLYRPASPWDSGSLMFRSLDGKLWPFQPGSALQSTCIDLIYARPGSGKSVLANAINLALCLSDGIKRLPRISIIDIGPSSSGLISLIKEALPVDQGHLAAYHRLTMSEEYCINPLDTQLGARFPTPPERSFLVNLISLLVTPIGEPKPYDGMADMVGLVIDEAYNALSDRGNPNVYTKGVNAEVDDVLEDIGFVFDNKTSWWEVTDALFMAGFVKEAISSQRYAVPMLSDLVGIARISNVEDLYGKVKTPTGEMLITTFTRMISSSVREYPILARPTRFDIGGARLVSLDLDEVAKAGGASSDRQTAVMYMIARYVLTKDFYGNIDAFSKLDKAYILYHEERIKRDKEDVKRIVMDEFHRTSHSQSVRDQVIQDMREGRKWGVQVGLISQSLDDFDSIMIDFATSIFIMDAGPEQSIKKSSSVFGLPPSAEDALRRYVRGPTEAGSTMLAIFATKGGTAVQLVTLTLGPVELWAFSTTAEDAVVRNRLYERLGPKRTRQVLSSLFPGGTARKYFLKKAAGMREALSDGESVDQEGLVDELVELIVKKSESSAVLTPM